MQESVSAMFSELTLWDPSTPNTQQEAIEHPHCDDILTTAHHKHLNPTPTLQLYHHSIPTSLYHFSIHIPSILILHQLRPGTPLKIIYLWLSLPPLSLLPPLSIPTLLSTPTLKNPLPVRMRPHSHSWHSHHSSSKPQLLTHRDPPQHLSQTIQHLIHANNSTTLSVDDLVHITHQTSCISHQTPRVVSSSWNVLSYHLNHPFSLCLSIT